MKIFDNHVYHSSMDVNDAVEGLIDPRIYQYVQFFDMTTCRYFKAQPSEVIRAWKKFVTAIKNGYEPTLNYFYVELDSSIPGKRADFILKKEPLLCLYVCEDTTHGALIAIDFEMF